MTTTTDKTSGFSAPTSTGGIPAVLPYGLARALLFRLDAERAHHLSMAGLRLLGKAGLGGLAAPAAVYAPVEVMGIQFPNQIGLAAGLDKEASCVDGLAQLGFGSIEVGTLTPRPQPGNPLPRLFRLKRHEAIINRMGFNNPGIVAGLANLRQRTWRGPVGINIGKNFDTPNEQAADDYLRCLEAAYDDADYIAANLSSPNTKGLRDLQSGDSLAGLVRALIQRRDELAKATGRRVPVAIKLAPDIEDGALADTGRQLVDLGADAIIATNTTIDRAAVAGHPFSEEAGGLSGRPVTDRSTQCVGILADAVDGAVPIIGVGGIFSGEDARRKAEAGAALVQIYTGFVYRGPALVREVAEALAS